MWRSVPGRFRVMVAGEEVDWPYVSDGNMDGDFNDVDPAAAEADFAAFRAEIEACDAAAAGRDLDEVFWNPRQKVEMNLRWVYVHVIQEYARHNGHADLIRERIDGATGY